MEQNIFEMEVKKKNQKMTEHCPAGLEASRNCSAGLGMQRNCPTGLGTPRNYPAGLGRQVRRNVKKRPAILTLPPHRPTNPRSPPLLKFGPPPEIDFFDVSDDLERKKKLFFVQKIFWTFLPIFFLFYNKY